MRIRLIGQLKRLIGMVRGGPAAFEFTEPFRGTLDVSEVTESFNRLDPENDPFLQSGDDLPGKCFVCGETVPFMVDRPPDGLPVNWRETLACSGCGMINRWRGGIHLFEAVCRPSKEDRIYLTEALGPVAESLGAKYENLVSREFSSDADRGALIERRGEQIRNEDVTRLTFPDEHFDSVLSFDVLEHVPNYQDAISEFYRVLGEGGHLVLTAPFSFRQQTTVRAVVEENGEIRHLVDPDYHGDPLSDGGVLAYYDFGMDLLDLLQETGFRAAALVYYSSNEWGYPGPNIAFIARKQSLTGILKTIFTRRKET